MKKNLTLLVIIVCCAFAGSSTNCFAQGLFVRGMKACSKRLPMVAARVTLHYNDYRANVGRRMPVATWTPEHNSGLSSGKGIKFYNSKMKELLLQTEKSKSSIIRLTAFELSPAEYIKGDSLLRAKVFKMRQSAAEAEEWTEPKGQVTSPQNPDNRQE